MNLSDGNCTQPKDFQEDESYRSKKSGYSSRAWFVSIFVDSVTPIEAKEGKAKLEYTLGEAKLKKEQASTEAKLEIVGAQKDAVIAEARLHALEKVQDCISVSSVADPVDQSQDPRERTKKFVEKNEPSNINTHEETSYGELSTV